MLPFKLCLKTVVNKQGKSVLLKNNLSVNIWTCQWKIKAEKQSVKASKPVLSEKRCSQSSVQIMSYLKYEILMLRQSSPVHTQRRFNVCKTSIWRAMSYRRWNDFVCLRGIGRYVSLRLRHAKVGVHLINKFLLTDQVHMQSSFICLINA